MLTISKIPNPSLELLIGADVTEALYTSRECVLSCGLVAVSIGMDNNMKSTL